MWIQEAIRYIQGSKAHKSHYMQRHNFLQDAPQTLTKMQERILGTHLCPLLSVTGHQLASSNMIIYYFASKICYFNLNI